MTTTANDLGRIIAHTNTSTIECLTMFVFIHPDGAGGHNVQVKSTEQMGSFACSMYEAGAAIFEATYTADSFNTDRLAASLMPDTARSDYLTFACWAYNDIGSSLARAAWAMLLLGCAPDETRRVLTAVNAALRNA
ncbi:hypothetical protein [Oceanidesulfovibrio marinus]|uniref:Uncharacterized protein n=1 Tax=Oceanidesulfovibrio marinus TaxID=370038 RepID=A0A6P1ZBW8_9BACT|nr:hypothetical protein [Oceanidesulfovibrio marinus]TVM31178.1 hypothetical protein DQK91_18890 [Oceanidesulfovibrio marinus]